MESLKVGMPEFSSEIMGKNVDRKNIDRSSINWSLYMYHNLVKNAFGIIKLCHSISSRYDRFTRIQVSIVSRAFTLIWPPLYCWTSFMQQSSTDPSRSRWPTEIMIKGWRNQLARTRMSEQYQGSSRLRLMPFQY